MQALVVNQHSGERSMLGDLSRLLEKFREVAEGSYTSQHSSQHNVYAISIFRGGIGKSTLAFNLAYQISREVPTLLADVCPQCNFTQSLLGDDTVSNTIYDALLPRVMAGTKAVDPANLLMSVPPACSAFKFGKPVFAIPGSKELFLFPSLLYTQLS